MKKILLAGLWLISAAAMAQTKVEEKISVTGESQLDLNFPFADEIRFANWDRNEVLVQATVSINDGKNDRVFKLKSRKSSDTIFIYMDELEWQNLVWDHRNGSWNTEIQYQVYFPAALTIVAETISGNYNLDYYGRPGRFKTISGDIDLNVPTNRGVDFRIKTISGEVYSDLNLDYPDGKDGLNQLVGINVRGQVFGGGPVMNMETISGNIYLRAK